MLLPHEDPASPHLDDARHWMLIYTELVGFKAGLFQRLNESVRDLSREAREEAGRSDIGALGEQRDRYQGRLDFWQERFWQLQGLELDITARRLTHRQSAVELTSRETELLAFLMASPGSFFTATEIASRAWLDDGLFPEQVRTYIGRLRRKLLDVGAPCQVVNRARRGYSLEAH
ncbi:MAG: Transcriptional regulatory protein terminal [Chloroflexota bacterium]|nr:Transcriptional regulatory protein terminal [Chloroflexota bacterium]